MKYLKRYNENYYGGIYTSLPMEDIDGLVVDLYDMLGDYTIRKGTYFTAPCYYIEFKHRLDISEDDPSDQYIELMGHLNVLKHRLKDLKFKIKFSIVNILEDVDDDLPGARRIDPTTGMPMGGPKKLVKIILY